MTSLNVHLILLSKNPFSHSPNWENANLPKWKSEDCLYLRLTRVTGWSLFTHPPTSALSALLCAQELTSSNQLFPCFPGPGEKSQREWGGFLSLSCRCCSGGAPSGYNHHFCAEHALGEWNHNRVRRSYTAQTYMHIDIEVHRATLSFMLPSNLPLWHADYFRLKAIKSY